MVQISNKMNYKKATIEDVAQLAGVSIATVSRALHKPDVVSQKTRDKVNEAVDKTGYTQNIMARNLRLDRTGMVVALIPDIGNPFFSEILAGIESVATREGYNVLIGNTNNDPAREHIYANYVRSNLADGILLLNGHIPISPNGITANQSNHSSTPLVAVCERIPNASVPTIIIDNVDAAYKATKHLLDLGHKSIAHIAGPMDNILSEDRLLGYNKAMSDAGLSTFKNSVFFGDFSTESGRRAYLEIIAAGATPTAVFCANDQMAMGAINAARENGQRVPDDLSVMGFDDISFASDFHPTLSTIHQPRRRLGIAAMERLLSILHGEDNNQSDTTILETNLVTRASTATLQ